MRKCERCGAEICECFGSVSVHDFLDFVEGKIAAARVKEWCGRCMQERALIEFGRGGP